MAERCIKPLINLTQQMAVLCQNVISVPPHTCPYAKMHTLYPSTADCTQWRVSSNTTSCGVPVKLNRQTWSGQDGTILVHTMVGFIPYIS